MTDREKLIELIQSAVGGCARFWAALIADNLLANGVTFATDTDVGSKVETNVYDTEEVYHNCTVQILHNTVTGEQSIGWWPEEQPPREVR